MKQKKLLVVVKRQVINNEVLNRLPQARQFNTMRREQFDRKAVCMLRQFKKRSYYIFMHST